MANDPADTRPQKAPLDSVQSDEAERARNITLDYTSCDTILSPPEQVVLAFVVGNFCSAFLQALGSRAGGGAADHLKRTRDLVHSRIRRKGAPDEYHIGIDGGAAATVVVTEDLPDEARLALLDLDVTTDELRGKLLRWDTVALAWRASEALPAEPGDPPC